MSNTCECTKKSSLFFYTRKEEQKDAEGKVISTKELKDSINTDHILRTMHMVNNGKEAVVIVMNDVHEEFMPMPITKPGGKVVYEQRKVPYNTQIAIEEPSDIARFFETYNK